MRFDPGIPPSSSQTDLEVGLIGSAGGFQKTLGKAEEI
jgi:hypothetical protein